MNSKIDISHVVKETFYDWAGGNLWLFRQINGLSGNPNYNDLMIQVSKLADTKTMFIPALAILLMVAIFNIFHHRSKGSPGFKYRLAEWFAIVSLFAVALPVNAAVNHILKEHFAYPRPYVVLESYEVNYLEYRTKEERNRSFPSGHVAFIACFVFALWEKLKDAGKILGVGAIVLIGWSRIALGVHFPADVFWSAIVTLMVVGLVRIALYTVLTKIFRLRW